MSVEKESTQTPLFVIAMIGFLLVALYGAFKLQKSVNEVDPKVACYLLDVRFKEVGHTEEWYTLTNEFLKSSQCDSVYYQKYGDLVRDQQICKTNYVKDRLAGKEGKKCSDMKLL